MNAVLASILVRAALCINLMTKTPKCTVRPLKGKEFYFSNIFKGNMAMGSCTVPDILGSTSSSCGSAGRIKMTGVDLSV